MISDFTKVRTAIPQAVELTELSELNRQARERAHTVPPTQRTDTEDHHHDNSVTNGGPVNIPSQDLASWV